MAANTFVDTVDDVNPQIVYTGAWEAAGVIEEYDSTTHGTIFAGAQATFIFNGTSIAVYGTIGHEYSGDPGFAPVSTYTIDGVVQGSFIAVPELDVLHRQRFFLSSALDLGREHTLVITNTLNGKNAFWLDFLEIQHGGNLSSSTTPVSTGSTTTGAGTGLPAATSNSTKPAEGSGSGVSNGMIVGASIGGAVAIFLLIVIILLLVSLLRQRNRRDKRRKDSASSWPLFRPHARRQPTFTPFNTTPETALLDGERHPLTDARHDIDVFENPLHDHRSLPLHSRQISSVSLSGMPMQHDYEHGYYTRGSTSVDIKHSQHASITTISSAGTSSTPASGSSRIVAVAREELPPPPPYQSSNL